MGGTCFKVSRGLQESMRPDHVLQESQWPGRSKHARHTHPHAPKHRLPAGIPHGFLPENHQRIEQPTRGNSIEEVTDALKNALSDN